MDEQMAVGSCVAGVLVDKYSSWRAIPPTKPFAHRFRRSLKSPWNIVTTLVRVLPGNGHEGIEWQPNAPRKAISLEKTFDLPWA